MLTAAIFFTLHARGRCCHHSPDSRPRKAKEQLGPGQSIIVSVSSGVRGEQRACAGSFSLSLSLSPRTVTAFSSTAPLSVATARRPARLTSVT